MTFHIIIDWITGIVFCILGALGAMTMYMLLSFYPRLKLLIEAAIDIRYIAHLVRRDFEQREAKKESQS
jgi:hypothetical protein